MRVATTMAKITSLLGAFLAIAVLMGLLGAGLLLPVVGTAGTAAREGVGLFEELPGDMDSNPLAQQSRIEAADGSLISTPALQNRIIVPLEQVAPVMQNAQVAIEDERYYEHGGVDPKALGRAVVTNATTEDTQGGSTLTQQYVKLTLKEQAEREGDVDAQRALLARSGTEGYVRKLRELKYAVTLEDRLSKDEILEGYLNLAYYGDRAYGIEAAARHYFGVRAKNLNLVQAATLAGVVRAPSVTDPVNFPEASKARRDVVLDKMYRQEMITKQEWEEAKASEITLDLTDSQQSCLNSKQPYFCDYVQAWLLQSDTLGATREEREQQLYTGGLTVETTLRPDLAQEIHQVTAKSVPPGNKFGLGSAAAMVEPGTGKVLAIGQSSDYSLEESNDQISETSLNWSVDRRFGGGTGFQIGSVAKAFSLVTALENGVTVDKTLSVRAPGRVDSQGTWVSQPGNSKTPVGNTHPAGIFFRSDFDSDCTLGEPYWGVRNAEDANFTPSITLRKATASSVNTAFATLASEIGTCKIKKTMARMGLNSGDGDEYGAGDKNNPPTYVLGSDDASPLTVASAYATIASGGTYCPPVPVERILDANGEEIPLKGAKCKKVVDPDVAAGVAELMQGVVDLQGSGFRAVLDNDQPAGGKTGTADGSVHTWFAGYTPQLSTAVWIGDPTGSKRYDGRLADITLGERFIEGQLYGSKLGAPMWKDIMSTALEGTKVEEFKEPSQDVLGSSPPQSSETVPGVQGLSEREAMQRISQAGLTPSSTYTSSSAPEGTVAYTYPGAGEPVEPGDTVTVYVSSG
jgi:membrane peptidoglycan carboxypeptidase